MLLSYEIQYKLGVGGNVSARAHLSGNSFTENWGGVRDDDARLDLLALNCSMKALMQSSLFFSLVHWKYDLDQKHLVLSIDGCNLDVIDQDFAKRCILRNSPEGIRFMGDSLTRYQYLNLVHFLATGNWTSDTTMPNENEERFSSWDEFYRITNLRLQGREICDCQRANGLRMENRYYEHGQIMISYNQIFGLSDEILVNDLQLLNKSSCKHSACQQGLCLPGACGSSQSLKNLGTISTPGALQKIFELFPSSDIFFNAGLWWISSEKKSTFPTMKGHFSEEVFNARKSGVKSRFHWKMTTESAAKSHPEYNFAKDLVDSATVDDIFDSLSITSPVFLNFPEMRWDAVHFETDIYVGLNLALISFICSK